MSREELKTIRTQITGCVQGQLGHLDKVNTKQLGEAIDMIKDLSEAIYYQTITESMEKADEKKEYPVSEVNYYTTPVYYRDPMREPAQMYYPTQNGSGMMSNGMNGAAHYYTEMRRDPREGRAAVRRRMYMEGKEMHNNQSSQLKQLEAYLQELSTDITEMIKDASTQQKATLKQKMMTLANKL